jgi:hypothetical protein
MPAALRAALLSRALVLGVAVAAAALLDLSASDAASFDAPRLTQPFGDLGDAIVSPLARWDAVWYLTIARDGYGGSGPDAAFFPLYPLLVALAGVGASPGALLVGAYAVSLAAFGGALHLLHRLASLELGPRHADAAVLLLALFPASLWFGAPYSESLFLLLSVGAFYAARTGRWAWAGSLAGLASATRSAGILLLIPLAILYLYGPREDAPGRGRHPLRRDAAWLLLAPAGLAAYSVHLAVVHGDAFAYLALQEAWHREFAGPFAGVWHGATAAFDGLRQLVSGSREPVYFEQAGGDPFEVARRNLTDFAFLLFALPAAWGVARRLPAAYGAYVVAALALPLSFPVGPQPLMSLPRFVSVLFPVFLWLALVCEERRVTRPVLVASSAGLAVLTAQFATWHWVA